jgi:hypothetical protein
MERIWGDWEDPTDIRAISYKCGYCNKEVAPSLGLNCEDVDEMGHEFYVAHVCICSSCNRATYIEPSNNYQVPSPKLGNDILYLPEDIKELYDEIRNCISVNAYNAVVLLARKLLMNVAVSKGAEENKKFVYYVDFFEQKNLIPSGSKEWVDHIRKMGNEATHELPSVDYDNAKEIIIFAEILLKLIYEFPNRIIAKSF